MIQGTPEWLEMRRKHLGASDAPIIMGVCKFKTADGRHKTPRLLWEEKLGLASFDAETFSTRYGKEMEEPARQAYEAITRHLVMPKIVYHHRIPYMMASLDGISLDGQLAVEIKNCSKEDHDTAKSGKVPEHYYPQVQHQLACLDQDEMHYFSFHKGEGIIVVVKRDEEYIKKLYRQIEAFWKCVQEMKEPPATDLDFRRQGQEWAKKAKVLWELEEKIRKDTKRADELKEELKLLCRNELAMGDNFRFGYAVRKGAVDYSMIPELQDVDLDQYRKAPVRAWRLKKV